MPTGGVHRGESVEEAAPRELSKEVGYRAGRLIHVCTYHTSFLGEGMVKLGAPPDDTEFIEVRPLPFHEVLRMVCSGEIVDSMTRA